MALLQKSRMWKSKNMSILWNITTLSIIFHGIKEPVLIHQTVSILHINIPPFGFILQTTYITSFPQSILPVLLLYHQSITFTGPSKLLHESIQLIKVKCLKKIFKRGVQQGTKGWPHKQYTGDQAPLGNTRKARPSDSMLGLRCCSDLKVPGVPRDL